MADRVLRASEIGEYVFCRRAWWYAGRGFPSVNKQGLTSGTRWHQRHGRKVVQLGCVRLLGYASLLAGIVAAAIYLADMMIR